MQRVSSADLSARVLHFTLAVQQVEHAGHSLAEQQQSNNKEHQIGCGNVCNTQSWKEQGVMQWQKVKKLNKVVTVDFQI